MSASAALAFAMSKAERVKPRAPVEVIEWGDIVAVAQRDKDGVTQWVAPPRGTARA